MEVPAHRCLGEEHKSKSKKILILKIITIHIRGNTIMFSKLQDLSTLAYLRAQDAIQKIERGDADSSGSTLRTVGVVALVLIVVAVLGIAIYGAASNAAGNINSASFNFK